MNRNRIDPAVVVLLILIAFYAYFLYDHAVRARYIMDEFLLASWAGDLYRGLRPYVDFRPPKTQLGTLPFIIPFLFSDDSEGIMLASRCIGFFFAVVSLGFLFLVQRNTFGGTRSGLWAVFWALSCSTFLERSMRIRVDMLATLLAILAVYHFLVLGSWRRALVAGAFLSLSFCTTQKAVLFILAFCVAFWAVCWRSELRPIRDFAVFALGGFGVFAIYVLVFGHGGHYAAVIRATFGVEETVNAALESPYHALYRFHWQTFSRNIPFYCLALLGLGYVLTQWRSNSWRVNFLSGFTVVVLAGILALKKPWPYVYVMIIPFLAGFAGHVFDRAVEALKSPHRVLAIPLAALLVTVGVHSIWRRQEHLSLTVASQLPSVRAAEATLGPDDTYFDGVRMIPTRKHTTLDALVKRDRDRLVKSWETEGPPFLQSLRDAHCKVFIYNYRLTVFPDDFHRFIKDHYVLVERNVFASGSDVTTSPQEVTLVWPGTYGVYHQGRCENIQVDGKPIDAENGELALEQGPHRVTYEGDGYFLLIPLGAKKYMYENRFDRQLVELFYKRYNL